MRPGDVLCGVVILLAATGGPCAAADVQGFSDLFGAWTVQKVVGATPVTANQQSADKPLGSRITISADRIATYEGSAGLCRPRHATVAVVDTDAELEKNWGTKMAGLYLPRGTIKSRLPLLDAGCAAALVIDRNTLLWTMANGYIYTVKRDAAE